jgi:hypothetical protein
MKMTARWVLMITMPFVLIGAACSSSKDASSPSTAGVPTTDAAAAGGSVSVSLNQWSITPTATTVPSGPVTFDVTNEGTMTREFVVLQTETAASEIPIKSFEGETDRLNEDMAGTNVGKTGDMEAGATHTLKLDLAPGHNVRHDPYPEPDELLRLERLRLLPTGMYEQPSAETGTVMRASTLERYATEAGFTRFEVLPIEHDAFRLYLLRP